MNQPETEVSLVFPAYNEAEDIERAVDAALVGATQDHRSSFEIIIAEDGSSDGTDAESPSVSPESTQRSDHIHSAERLGRGRALNRAFKESAWAHPRLHGRRPRH